MQLLSSMLLLISDLFLGSIGLVMLLFGSIQDIKEREVYDVVSYTSLALAVIIRLYYFLSEGNLVYVVAPLISFGIALAFSLLMYYGGQWGGGDVKVLLALSLLIGSQPSFFFSSKVNHWIAYFSNNTYVYSISFFLFFLLLSLFAGVIVGLIFAIIIAAKKYNRLRKEISVSIGKYRFVIFTFFVISLLFFSGFLMTFQYSYLWAAIAILIFDLIIPFFGAVEKLMYREVTPNELTEGDWIDEDIEVDGKIIYSKSEPGVTLSKIRLLKKLYKEHKIKKLKVKDGFPFVPAFLIAYVCVYLLYFLF